MKSGKANIVLMIGAAILFAACSSGGSGSSSGGTVAGIAAAGAPLVGYVEVKDSTGATKKVATGANGAYSLDLSGLTAPYMLKAEGAVGDKVYTIYSAITTDDFGGTVNVTTLSDVIVGNVVGMTAAAYYAASPTDFSKLTSANLVAAETTLQQSLQDVINAMGITNPTTVDLLHTAFVPNNQGLDLLLDVLQVTIDPVANTATITNTAVPSGPQSVFVDSLASKTDTLVITATGMPVTDLAAIAQQMAALQALFKTSKPAANDPALLALFDQSPGAFLWSGRDLSRFLNLLIDPQFPSVGIGFQVTQVVLTPLNAPVAATAQVIMTLPEGDIVSGQWSFTKVNDVWKAQGDQRKTFSKIGTKVSKQTVGTTVTTSSGLHFGDVEDDSQAQNISYAVVVGKGLPQAGAGRDGNSAGLLLVKSPTSIGASFYIAQPPYKGEGTSLTPLLDSTPGNWNIFPLTNDALISTFSDNEPYGFDFYSDPNNTPSNTADDQLVQHVVNILRKPPLTTADRAAAQFATVTGPPPSTLAAYAQGGISITVTWTLPQGFHSSYVEIVRSTLYQSVGYTENNPQGSVGGAAVSRVLDPLSLLRAGETVTGFGGGVEIFDVPGRYYEANIYYPVP